MHKLGYHDGRGVVINLEKTVYWLQKSAEAGHLKRYSKIIQTNNLLHFYIYLALQNAFTFDKREQQEMNRRFLKNTQKVSCSFKTILNTLRSF